MNLNAGRLRQKTGEAVPVYIFRAEPKEEMEKA